MPRNQPPDVPDSDDATKEGLSLIVSDDAAKDDGLNYVDSEELSAPIQITPGTELGEGERFNMPRPLKNQLHIIPINVTSGQVIEISEVRRKSVPEHMAYPLRYVGGYPGSCITS